MASLRASIRPSMVVRHGVAADRRGYWRLQVVRDKVLVYVQYTVKNKRVLQSQSMYGCLT
jgi:putative lipase involved disintegration of autophagic bodies